LLRVRCQLEKCPFADTTAEARCIVWYPDGTYSKCTYAIVEFQPVEFPETCPVCGAQLFCRAELDNFGDYTFEELWECDNHHVFRAIYKLVKVVRLKETEK